MNASPRGARTVASPGRWRSGRRRTGSDSPARLPGEILGRLLQDLPLGGQLRRLGPQRRVLGLEPSHPLLERLVLARPGWRCLGLQGAGGQRPVGSGLLARPVRLEPVPQRAAHDAQILGDAADRGPWRGLVQVDGLTTELLGVVLPGHGSRIISLPQHHVLDSACPRTGVRPRTRIPHGVMTVVTGVAGSGKSSLILGSLPSVEPDAVVIDQRAIRGSRRSNPATFTGLLNL